MVAASMDEDAVPEADPQIEQIAQQEAEEAAAWAEEHALESESDPEEDLDEVAQEEAEEAAAWAAQEAQRLGEIHAAAKKQARRPSSMVHAVLRSRLGAYTATEVHRVGEVADLLVATREISNGPDERCLLKVVRSTFDIDLLETEARVLGHLHSKTDEKSKFFRKYLPTVIDSFPVYTPESVTPRAVNVLDFAEEYVSLAEINAAYPDGIDTLDVVWMLRRTFEILGWVHAQGYVHGAVVPEHVLVNTVDHGAKLVGWSYAVWSGHALSAVSALRKSMYPDAILRRSQATAALDVAMAVETACMLMSDKTGQMRADVPEPLRAFFSKCGWMQVSDGWAAYREYDEILKRLYGKRRYRKFAMPV